MPAVKATSSHESRPVFELSAHCEIQTLASRIATAVSNFFKIVARIILNNWLYFSYKVLGLLPEHIACRLDPKRNIIHRILETPANDRADVMTYALALISPQMDQGSKNAFIKAVTANDRNTESRIVKGILPLITPEMYSFPNNVWHELAITGNDRVIRAIAAVPADNRQVVLQYAYSLFTQDMYTLDKGNVILALANVPVNDIEDVITYASPLFNQNMGSVGKGEIIEAIAAVPAGSRSVVLYYTSSFCDQGMYSTEKASIINAIASVPLEDIDDVTAAVAPLFIQNTDGHTRAGIIKSIASVPIQERKSVVNNAALLITGNMSTNQKVLMIAQVAAIPSHERTLATSLALRLLTRGDVLDRQQMLATVVAIAAADRENVVFHAEHVITEQMPLYEKILIINWVAAMPIHERERTIGAHVERIMMVRQEAQAALLQILDAPRAIGLDAAHAAGEDVHASDRDQRTKEALMLLYDYQRTISPKEIKEAAKAFIAYLDASAIDPARKKLAKDALLKPRRNGESFGPLIDRAGFSVRGFHVSGEDFIGRLWLFVSKLDANEAGNAKQSMVFALSDSYAGNARVCNQGKTQRLLIAALQGRLANVNIDGVEETPNAKTQVPISECTTMFFNVEAHRNIENIDDLLDAANQFCDANQNVNREEFIREIHLYAAATFD